MRFLLLGVKRKSWTPYNFRFENIGLRLYDELSRPKRARCFSFFLYFTTLWLLPVPVVVAIFAQNNEVGEESFEKVFPVELVMYYEAKPNATIGAHPASIGELPPSQLSPLRRTKVLPVCSPFFHFRQPKQGFFFSLINEKKKILLGACYVPPLLMGELPLKSIRHQVGAVKEARRRRTVIPSGGRAYFCPRGSFACAAVGFPVRRYKIEKGPIRED